MVILFLITSAAAWLLAGAGGAKLLRPSGTASALRQLLPIERTAGLARLLGVIEIITASAFLIRPGIWTGFTIGSLYLGLVIAAATLRANDTECGCFGSVGGRVTANHIIVSSILAGAGFATTLLGPDFGTLPEIVLVPLAAIPIALLVYAVLVPLVDLQESMRQLQP